jgi:hypothetical protein
MQNKTRVPCQWLCNDQRKFWGYHLGLITSVTKFYSKYSRYRDLFQDVLVIKNYNCNECIMYYMKPQN